MERQDVIKYTAKVVVLWQRPGQAVLTLICALMSRVVAGYVFAKSSLNNVC